MLLFDMDRRKASISFKCQMNWLPMLLDWRFEESADFRGVDAGNVCDAAYGHIWTGFKTGILEFFDGLIYIQAILIAI